MSNANQSPPMNVQDPVESPAPKLTVPPPLRSEFADDQDMIEIIEAFIEEMPDRISKLTACWHAQQLDELRRLSHQLKGASGGYGYAELGQSAGKFESTLNGLSESGTKDPMTGLRNEFESLVALCNRVRK